MKAALPGPGLGEASQLSWLQVQEIAGSLEEAVSQASPQQAGQAPQDGNTLSLQLAPTLALHKCLLRCAAAGLCHRSWLGC